MEKKDNTFLYEGNTASSVRSCEQNCGGVIFLFTERVVPTVDINRLSIGTLTVDVKKGIFDGLLTCTDVFYMH